MLNPLSRRQALTGLALAASAGAAGQAAAALGGAVARVGVDGPNRTCEEAVGACDQHIVLDLQKPQLGHIVEELVGGARYLIRCRKVDVAVVAVEIGQGKARGERGGRRGREDFVEMVREG